MPTPTNEAPAQQQQQQPSTTSQVINLDENVAAPMTSLTQHDSVVADCVADGLRRHATLTPPSPPARGGDAGGADDDDNGHWSRQVRETVVSTGFDGLLHITVLGGADTGRFCWIGGGDSHGVVDMVRCHSGRLRSNAILLEVDGEHVAGYTLGDLLKLLWSRTDNGQPVLLKTVDTSFMTTDLRQFLSRRFQKDSLDHNLQRTIRFNVYRRTLPCTTRSPRHGEVSGLHYRFLSVDEFLALEGNGRLLESGIYEGNYYGTPMPPKDPNDPPLHWGGTGKATVDSSKPLLPAAVQRGSLHDNNGRTRTYIHSVTSTVDHGTSFNAPGSDSGRISFNEDEENATRNPASYQHSSDLPDGWERVNDSVYGIYYIDHNNKKTQYECPTRSPVSAGENGESRTFGGATRQLVGEIVHSVLTKAPTGLGFTIVGSEDTSNNLLLQIKTILPNGPACVDGKLRTGDVLVRVDGRNIFGFSHLDVAELFRSIPVGSRVDLEICRGNYPLPFEPGDPQTKVITTVAVSPINGSVSETASDTIEKTTRLSRATSFTTWNSHFRWRSYDATTKTSADDVITNGQGRRLLVHVTGCSEGFGFTVWTTMTSTSGGLQAGAWCVRDVTEPGRCGGLHRGDVLLAVNGIDVSEMSHCELMKVLRQFQTKSLVDFVVFRSGSPENVAMSGDASYGPRPPSCCRFPVCDIPPSHLDKRISPVVVSSLSGTPDFVPASAYHCRQRSEGDYATAGRRHLANAAVERPARVFENDMICERSICLPRGEHGFGFRIIGGAEEGTQVRIGHIVPGGAADGDGRLKVGDTITSVDGVSVLGASHRDVVRRISESANHRGHVTLNICSNRVDLMEPSLNYGDYHQSAGRDFGKGQRSRPVIRDVTLTRTANEGYGFVIVSSLLNSASVIGRLTPGGPADRSGKLHVGDQIIGVNDIDISILQHHEIVDLVRSSVDLRLVLTVASTAQPIQSYPPNEPLLEVVELVRGPRGFGFSIRGGREFDELPLLILKVADGGAAHIDGRLQVNDEIIEINGCQTRGMTHSAALEMIQNVGPSIRLTVRHSKPQPGASSRPVDGISHITKSTSNSPSLSNELTSAGTRPPLPSPTTSETVQRDVELGKPDDEVRAIGDPEVNLHHSDTLKVAASTDDSAAGSSSDSQRIVERSAMPPVSHDCFYEKALCDSLDGSTAVAEKVTCKTSIAAADCCDIVDHGDNTATATSSAQQENEKPSGSSLV